jgi:hypothetical protein
VVHGELRPQLTSQVVRQTQVRTESSLRIAMRHTLLQIHATGVKLFVKEAFALSSDRRSTGGTLLFLEAA